MYTTMQDAYSTVMRTFEDVTSRLTEADAAVKSADLEEIVDSAYACREILRLLKDLETQVRKKQDLLNKVGCMIAAKVTMGGPVRTEYCTATPDVKTFATAPKPGDEGYSSLMRRLGVPDGAPGLGVLRPHFKDLSTYLTSLQEAGEDLPPELTKTYTEWRLNIVKRKEVDGRAAVDSDDE